MKNIIIKEKLVEKLAKYNKINNFKKWKVWQKQKNYTKYLLFIKEELYKTRKIIVKLVNFHLKNNDSQKEENYSKNL